MYCIILCGRLAVDSIVVHVRNLDTEFRLESKTVTSNCEGKIEALLEEPAGSRLQVT